MTTLNDFFPQLGTQDTKKKLTLGADIINYLEQHSSMDCEDLGAFIDSIVVWLNSSNFKVALNGLEILVHFVDKLQDDFRLYISTVLPHAVDRLGDNKDQVREEAQLLLQKLMNQVATPQAIFDKLSLAFTHKNGRVRQEVLVALQKVLQQHGAQALSLSKLVPFIVKLLGDPTAFVRDEAVTTLVEIYRHVGERVRLDLAKKYNVPAPKLQLLMAKFDELRDGGELMPTALVTGTSSTTSSVDGGCMDDEVDRDIGFAKSPAKNRACSAPPTRRGLFTLPAKPAPQPLPTSSSISAALPRKRSFRTPTTAPIISSGQAGAVDEETFIRTFEEVPKIEFFSSRELESQLYQIKDTLSDANADWEKRIDHLKKLRALIVAGAPSYDEFYPCLRLLEQPFQTTVKDLRSQVVREACISIAYLSQQLGSRFDHFAEALFVCLINLIPNSAKVMATAGIVAIRFVIRYTHASRLIPIITGNMSSKSKDIRKAMCEFLDQLLHTWPTHSLERHIAVIQEAIKKGISDADSEARAFSRKAFWGFHDHFKEQGESLLLSLESSKQRMLQGEFSMSSSSSNNSLQGSAMKVTRKASSTAGSTENLNRVGSFSNRRTGIPVLGGGRADSEIAYSVPMRQNGASPMRSNSAIDVNAAQRARARQAYATAARLKVGSVASLPRPMRKPKEQPMTTSAITSPERIARSRNKTGTSQSQPGSRSASPSSRLSYTTYAGMHGGDGQRMIGAVGTGRSPYSLNAGKRVPRSTGTSRETSPTRQLYSGRERRLSGSQKRSPLTPNSTLRNRSFGSSSASPHLTSASPVMAQKILLQSQEAEAAMADALRVSPHSPVNQRRSVDAFGNESDDSETSSVCSERSINSIGTRAGNLQNWHSSLPHVWTNGWEYVAQDINEIIQNLSSQNWSERKDGLYGLQYLLHSHRLLSPSELKRVTEIFTKLFMDPHTKLFTLFLDTLNELIITHRSHLHDWLYVLLARLFNKQGNDILGSVLAKIQRTLEIVCESFPFDLQFQTVAHFLNDQAQTPNLKVKLAALAYLQSLSQLMDGSDVRVTPDSTAAFTKIITWTTDPKSAELRRAAQGVLFAYFSLNTPEITKLLNQLPVNLQDSAFCLLQNMLVNPPSPMAQRLYTPNTAPRPRQPKVSPGPADTENVNPEDIYVSLRQTSAEIQNFFDGLSPSLTKEKRELDRDTTSQDSGISQMSVVDGKVDNSEDKFLISPEDRSPGPHNISVPSNGFGHNIYEADDSLDYSLSIEDCLAIVSDKNRSAIERKKSLLKIIDVASSGSEEIWDNNFRLILRTILDAFEDSDSSVRAQSLMVLCDVLRHQTFRFQGFTELTILKVLNAQKESDKDVMRAAEQCAAVLAETLSVEQSVKVMNPIILTGDFPVNQAAVKMLTKVIEQHTVEEVQSIVGAVMPGLLKAYNSPESSLRKAAVFCMVALHSCVGEPYLRPYLSDLNGSKLKLLNVYIKRAQTQVLPGSQTSSSPGSPKSAPVSRQE